MDSSDNTYKIPKLKGNENYDSWRADIIDSLKAKGLWWVTSGKLIKPELPVGDITGAAINKHNDALLAWEDKNDRACGMIGLTVERGPRIHIENIEIATERWSILKDHYGDSDFTTRHLALKALTQSKQSDFKSIQDYADSLKRASVKCSNVGSPLPDWAIAHLFLLGLNEAELNIKEMAVALADHDKRSNHEESAGGLAVKFGKSKPRNPSKSRENSDKVPICEHCSHRGHTKQQCYKLNPHLRPEWKLGENRRNPAKDDAGNGSGVKIVRSMKVSTSSQDVATNAWGISSVTENHVCYDKELFEMESYRKVTGASIITANNGAVPIIGKGNVLFDILLDGELSQIRLIDVYHCPNLRYNLLSVAQIVVKGYTCNIEKGKFSFTDPKGDITLTGSRIGKAYYVDTPSSRSVILSSRTNKAS